MGGERRGEEGRGEERRGGEGRGEEGRGGGTSHTSALELSDCQLQHATFIRSIKNGFLHDVLQFLHVLAIPTPQKILLLLYMNTL